MQSSNVYILTFLLNIVTNCIWMCVHLVDTTSYQYGCISLHIVSVQKFIISYSWDVVLSFILAIRSNEWCHIMVITCMYQIILSWASFRDYCPLDKIF